MAMNGRRKARARPKHAPWDGMRSTICKKVLKAKDFVPILRKCHENVEDFSQCKGKLRLHDMLLRPRVARPLARRAVNDDGMRFPLEWLASITLSQSVFATHYSSNMSLKPELAKSVTKVTDNRLEFDIC